MCLRDCGKHELHQKSRVKLLAKFGQAPAGSVVGVDICPDCGSFIAAVQVVLSDQGSYLIPAKLAEIIKE